MMGRIERDQAGYLGQNPDISEQQAYDMAKLQEVNRIRVRIQTTMGISPEVERIVRIAATIKDRITSKSSYK